MPPKVNDMRQPRRSARLNKNKENEENKDEIEPPSKVQAIEPVETQNEDVDKSDVMFEPSESEPEIENENNNDDDSEYGEEESKDDEAEKAKELVEKGIAVHKQFDEKLPFENEYVKDKSRTSSNIPDHFKYEFFKWLNELDRIPGVARTSINYLTVEFLEYFNKNNTAGEFDTIQEEYNRSESSIANSFGKEVNKHMAPEVYSQSLDNFVKPFQKEAVKYIRKINSFDCGMDTNHGAASEHIPQRISPAKSIKRPTKSTKSAI
eukprot:TRINITY_DN2698_c0_g1_i3.p2 TRINITY_DN2698_c0_g1~~TRINITY_DN2698_c0_g1_i3.p2  ORF type:complete len:264 (+),score=61.49 TRINITY_DN2698_c0_g1_i3:162-953(+)